MPYHKVPRASLHEDIRAIEREHEIIVQVLSRPDDPDCVDVFTRYCGIVLDSGPVEIRS